MPYHPHLSDALNFLTTNSEAIITQVLERQFAASPGQPWSTDSNARLRCIEDNRFHLHYLGASISAGNPTIFSDYCGWVKVVLYKRGVAVSHFETNLRHLRDLVLASAPERVADVIVGHLEIALRHLPEHPDEPAPVALGKSNNPLVSQYVEKVIALDSEGASRLIESSVTDADSVLDLYVNVLQPAQREIGRLWQVNSISVAVEHYATATTQRILNRISHSLPRRRTRGARFVGLCPEGEHHCLGLQMVCDLCRLDGWDTHFIGANTPAASAITLVTQLQPDIIGVSMTTLIALHNTSSLIARLKQALPDAIVLSGGYAASLGPDLWKSFGADAYAADAASALITVNRILRDRKAGGRPRKPADRSNPRTVRSKSD
jgi:methanogenic corrinoid protein MtbC1